MKEYALYQGDEFIEIGTLEKLARLLNIKERTAYFYTTRAYKKRLKNRKHKQEGPKIIISLDDEIDDDGVAIS